MSHSHTVSHFDIMSLRFRKGLGSRAVIFKHFLEENEAVSRFTSMELLKKLFPTILDLKNAKRAKIVLFSK